MRIVVTGASGNVGTALLRRLLPEHEVVGLARRTPGGGYPYDGASWVPVDLADPASEQVLAEVLPGADAVVHLAWGFQPSHDTRYLEALGVGGTRRVLQSVDQARVPHLLHMSSVGAYSHKVSNEPVDESWPTAGIASSPYSRHKSTAERLLDTYEQEAPPAERTVVTRLRPGIVGQRGAGSALLRYGVPALVPAGALRLLPVVPLDPRLAIPMVHADDVADAIVLALQARAGGAFNLAAEPVVTSGLIAAALGARLVPVPAPALRAAMSAAWHARLQAVDPGWLDLGYGVPLLDTGRAQRELGWRASVPATTVLTEVVEGMAEAAAEPSPALRPRTVADQVGRLLRHGPVSQRRLP